MLGMETQLKLQVASIRPQEAGGSFARLSTSAFSALGISEGDVVEVVGKKRTAVLAMRAYGENEGLNVRPLDGRQRENTGVSSGDHVEVRTVKRRRRFAPQSLRKVSENTRKCCGR